MKWFGTNSEAAGLPGQVARNGGLPDLHRGDSHGLSFCGIDHDDQMLLVYPRRRSKGLGPEVAAGSL